MKILMITCMLGLLILFITFKPGQMMFLQPIEVTIQDKVAIDETSTATITDRSSDDTTYNTLPSSTTSSSSPSTLDDTTYTPLSSTTPPLSSSNVIATPPTHKDSKPTPPTKVTPKIKKSSNLENRGMVVMILIVVYAAAILLSIFCCIKKCKRESSEIGEDVEMELINSHSD